MKIIGYITVAIFISFIITLTNFLTGNGYVFQFIHTHSLEISTTLLGFNIAVHTILIGQLGSIEAMLKKIGLFQKTRSELRQNALANIFFVSMIFFCELAKISPSSILATKISIDAISKYNYILEVISLCSIILIIFLIIETVNAVYKIYSFNQEKNPSK
jgi:hypothetical protein